MLVLPDNASSFIFGEKFASGSGRLHRVEIAWAANSLNRTANEAERIAQLRNCPIGRQWGAS